MASYIWKDYEVTLGSGDSADYTIRTSTSTDDIIYSGTAWKKPGETNIKIIINDICADYLRQELPNLEAATGLQTCNTYMRTFYVYVGTTQKASVEFLYDYSYDDDAASTSFPHSLADPVDGIVDINMPLVRTLRLSTNIIHYFEVSNSFNTESFNDDFDIMADSQTTISGIGNYVRQSSFGDIGMGITFEESSGWTTYRFADTCSRFALYYVNELGGWDFLVMQGGFKRIDKYKRYEMKRKYNNAVSTNRGRWQYANEETFAYELRTSLLTDDQASRMHHLLGSNMVYLYDLYTNICYPVVMTDNSCEYKTYKNNGLKMVQYIINVEIAKEQTRR